jgi:hypothetical protein
MQSRSFTMPRVNSRRRPNRLQAGQVVEVTCGALAGLCGVLLRCTGDSRWAVRLDVLGNGVLLVIDAAYIEHRDKAAVGATRAPNEHRPE